MTSRRDLLRALGASALMPSLAHAALTTPRRTAVPAVGIQLYLARSLMRADPEGTIARIAEIGFAEVEWWGRWDRSAAQLRATLDANGLRAPSCHVGTAALQPDQLPALLDVAKTMGHERVVVASLDPGERQTADDWKRAAALLNRAGRAAHAHGVRVGYHNHGYEWTHYDRRSAFEILITETDPAYVDFQLDVYWALSGGSDPLSLLRHNPERITSLHLKDAVPSPTQGYAQVDLGTGIIDWPTIIREGAAARVTSLYLDLDDPADVWATAGSARRYLRSLGY
jgi:sugar phosphate isomerase/epimerase